jgi:methylmalonyl-CoA mutase
MVEFTTREMPRWYPISISGYHIGEAGSTPVQQAAYTLSNGFAYAEMFAARGIPIDQFGPRLSFFLDCGLDAEYIALARVSRRIWAIGMRDVFGAGPRAQLFKLHTQTSGRSLIAAEFKIISPAQRRINARLHERDEFVSLKQRGRTVHNAK